MPEIPPTYQVPRRRSRPLDATKARRLAVNRMTTDQLWVGLTFELRIAVSSAANWDTRESFYAAVRAQAMAVELRIRGAQLRLEFPEAGTTALDPMDEDKSLMPRSYSPAP